MATHIGRDGVIKVGANSIAALRSFSVEETADTVETTTMAVTARTHKVTLTSFSGSADVYWDEDDAAQTALAVGTEDLTIEFYPEGTAVGSTYYTGTMHVTGVSKSSSFDGMVEASITFQGTGALTDSTVS